MQWPIETSTISFLAVSEPEQMTEHESDKPRLDKDGQALFVLRLVALTTGQAEVLAVRMAGSPPKSLAPGSAVRCIGLTATPWSMGERSGITYRAERIEPVSAPTRQAS
jgi:hypothetical protein